MGWQREASPRVLSVSWEPERPSIIGAEPGGGACIWVPPVDRAEVHVIRPLVLLQVLPEATAWLEEAFVAGNAWQASRHERNWQFLSGRVEHRDRDGIEALSDPG